MAAGHEMTQISVVIPSKNPASIESTLESLLPARRFLGEIVIVDASLPPIAIPSSLTERLPVRVIASSALQLEAECLGIEQSTSPRILLLDSDQLVTGGLIEELSLADLPAVVIPETCRGNGLVARLVRRNSEYLEETFRRRPSISVPVVPRFFWTRDLQRAVSSVRDRVRRTKHWPNNHMDTVLFYYWIKTNEFDLAVDVGFSTRQILHVVPGIGGLVAKAHKYGVGRGRLESTVSAGLSSEDRLLLDVIRRIDNQRVYRAPGLGWNYAGVVYDAIRGAAYFSGVIWGRASS